MLRTHRTALAVALIASIVALPAGCAEGEGADLGVSQQALSSVETLGPEQPRKLIHYTALVSGELLGLYQKSQTQGAGLTGKATAQWLPPFNTEYVIPEAPATQPDMVGTIFIDLHPPTGVEPAEAFKAMQIDLDVIPDCQGHTGRGAYACQRAFVAEGPQSFSVDALAACAGQSTPCEIGFTVSIGKDIEGDAVDIDVKVQTEVIAPAGVTGMVSVYTDK